MRYRYLRQVSVTTTMLVLWGISFTLYKKGLPQMTKGAVAYSDIRSFSPITRSPNRITSKLPCASLRLLHRNSDSIQRTSLGAKDPHDGKNVKYDNPHYGHRDNYDGGEENTATEFWSSAIETSNTHHKARKIALHTQLTKVGIDPTALSDAAIRSITTTDGYDPKYGKSAIRAYRSYMCPRQKKKGRTASGKGNEDQNQDGSTVNMKIEIVAASIARQIEFLVKRNRSHMAEWVRHTDSELNPAKNTNEMKKNTFPLILLLDNVRSAFNVGSIFRTADACNCHEILTTGITPHPNGSGMEKVQKSALGADRIVSTKHFGTTLEAIEYLRIAYPRWMIVGLETTDGSQCYTDVVYPGGGNDGTKDIEMSREGMKGSTDKEIDTDINKTSHSSGTVLVLGNEVTGVDTEIMTKLDLIVEIPMFGAKNSLNIAACAPVVMYEILRQWGKSKIKMA